MSTESDGIFITNEQRDASERILTLARRVANEPPNRPHRHTNTARVSWVLVQELRAAFRQWDEANAR